MISILLPEHTPFLSCQLVVILSNTFQRITFVNNEFTERMTLDFNISFSNTMETKALTDYYVLEIKQPKSTNSPIVNALKLDGIRQRGFSKYIYGVMLLHPIGKEYR